MFICSKTKLLGVPKNKCKEGKTNAKINNTPKMFTALNQNVTLTTQT
jgi:hypothetical protein